MAKVPVLSIRQPHINDIFYGKKRIENRSWYPPEKLIGKSIYLHASGRHKKLTTGAILGHARLAGVIKPREDGKVRGPAEILRLIDDEFLCPGEIIIDDVHKHYDQGSEYQWILDRITRLDNPIRIKGKERIWYAEIPLT